MCRGKIRNIKIEPYELLYKLPPKNEINENTVSGFVDSNSFLFLILSNVIMNFIPNTPLYLLLYIKKFLTVSVQSIFWVFTLCVDSDD